MEETPGPGTSPYPEPPTPRPADPRPSAAPPPGAAGARSTDTATHALPPPDGVGGEYGEGLEAFKDWVRANQTVALLGSFAVGVFLGVMMRR